MSENTGIGGRWRLSCREHWIFDFSWSLQHNSVAWPKPVLCIKIGSTAFGPRLNQPFFFATFQHRDTQQTLTVLERLDLDTEKPTAEETAKKFGFEDDFYSGNISWWQKTKPKIWSTFDEPYSSSLAKVERTSSSWNFERRSLTDSPLTVWVGCIP